MIINILRWCYKPTYITIGGPILWELKIFFILLGQEMFPRELSHWCYEVISFSFSGKNGPENPHVAENPMENPILGCSNPLVGTTSCIQILRIPSECESTLLQPAEWIWWPGQKRRFRPTRDRQPWMTLGALGRKANRDWRSRAAGWEKTCLGVRMLNIPCLSISSRLRIRKFVRPVMAMLIPTNSSGWRLTPWSLTIFHHGFIVIESSSQPGFSAMDFNHEMGISSFWGKKSEVSWL